MIYTILGAGIAGLSAAYHLNKAGHDCVIYEKQDRYGGLCDNFSLEGFRFDYCVHFSFTKNKYVKDIFERSVKFYHHKPISYNYSKGIWIKHPIQNNLYPLPIDEKIKIIKSFINRNYYREITNYEDWLKAQYGFYFSRHYPMKYTRKYWTLPAKKLETSWVGNRMHKSTIDEVLRGAISENEDIFYYTNEMRYPQKGGYKSIMNSFVNVDLIKFNKEVYTIDPVRKKLEFKNKRVEYFEELISSLPLPKIIKMIKNIPKKVEKAAEKLVATQVDLVSLGFKRPDIAKYLWFYIYDEDILPARAYSPNLKSPDNVPKNCSSLQFEVYSSKYKPLNITGSNLIEHIVGVGKKVGLFSKNDIIVTDHRTVKYGNVIFDHNIKKSRKIVQDYLDSIGIKYIGRFGEWDYLWSDQSFLSGKRVVEKIGEV